MSLYQNIQTGLSGPLYLHKNEYWLDIATIGLCFYFITMINKHESRVRLYCKSCVFTGVKYRKLKSYILFRFRIVIISDEISSH